MTAHPPPAEPEAARTPSAGPRELAVARPADPDRARAEQRARRFVDAALELLTARPGGDFTVQDVVKTSGQSLRSFYQLFTGKHELLLALFEKSARRAADRLRETLAEEPDAAARLRRFSPEYARLCRPRPGGGERAREHAVLGMPEPARQLLTEHPEGMARAFAPLRAVLEELLDRAAADGAVRPGLDHRLVAGTLLHAVTFQPFALTVGGITRDAGEQDAEALGDMLLRGITAPGAAG
ncbi:TetR/AcrR family transcriptional regulator [Streptomyces sp. NPDC056600]|uniref:TetR/AcrR family transcriptional regulator n=1 Tax=Streptomyces sp. NPDC056600 TaxID=3345874 RepID=UPI00367CEA69